MAAYLFADAIIQGARSRSTTTATWSATSPISTISSPACSPHSTARPAEAGAPHALYNLGNHRPVQLRRFVAVLEEALGRQAEIELAPLPPGDVVRTCADIEASQRDLGFEPKTPIEDGLPRFVAWYREYHGL